VILIAWENDMPRVFAFRWILAVILVGPLGCGKKSKPNVADAPALPDTPNATDPTPARKTASQHVKQIQQSRGEIQIGLIEDCATLTSDPQLIPELIKALKDPFQRGEEFESTPGPGSTREAVILALLNCGPAGERAALEQGVPMLKAALESPSAPIRGHALVAISRLGERAKPLLPEIWSFATDPSEFVRDRAILAAREIDLPHPDSAPLLKLLTHESADVRLTAGRHLLDFRPLPDSAVLPLARCLDKGDSGLRSLTFDLLREFGPAAEPAIPALLQDLDAIAAKFDPQSMDNVDTNALEVLVGIGKPALKPLQDRLGSTKQLARFFAAYGLAELGPDARPALAELEKALNDQYADVALESARAILTLTPENEKAQELLQRALVAPGPLVRAYALQTISRMGKSGQLLTKAARDLINDPEPQVRLQAVRALSRQNRKAMTEALPLLRKRLQTEGEETRVLREVLDLLAELGPLAEPSRSDVLAVAIRDQDLRLQALQTLAELGRADDASLSRLVPLMLDTEASAEIRTQALAIAVQAGAKAADVLGAWEKLLTDANADVRREAARWAGRHPAPSPSFLAALGKAATADRVFAVRIPAMRSIALLGRAARILQPQITRFTSDKVVEYAYWARIAVARFEGREEEVATTLRETLHGKTTIARAGVFEALGRIIPLRAEDVKRLAVLAQDRSAAVRLNCVEAIERSGALAVHARDRLISLLKDPSDEVRRAAARTVTLLSLDPPLSKALREMSQSDDAPTARAARIALRTLGGME
jgi:hypothetical protein